MTPGADGRAAAAHPGVGSSAAAPPADGVRFGTTAGRWVLLATVLGSGVAFLDGTVVNVALPTIGRDLRTGFATLQWVLDAYLLTLGSFVLVGGVLGDIYGRRRTFVLGLLAFVTASVACGLAPTPWLLVGARALQGVGAALLVPGSLAILSATFTPADRGRAVGAWSGLSGVSTAVGPFLGGYLVDASSWRWVFLINVPLVAVAVVVALRHVPESRDPAASTGRLDLPGAATAVLGLGLLVFALIEQPRLATAAVIALSAAGTATLVAFVVIESHRAHPMLPLELFRSRDFTVANLTTVVVYAALGGALFLVVLELQRVLHYSALASGAALLPVTLLLLLLSSRAGALSARTGPRLPMTVGPLLAGAGLLLLARIGPGASYLGTTLPGVLVFGLGLALTVAPLTTTVLAAVGPARSGVASGVNNAVARVAGLVAVAVLPLLAGLSDPAADIASDPAGVAFTAGFRRATVLAAALCTVGGLVSLVGLRNRTERPPP